MTSFGWDYPPGVTGNEPEIAGYDETESRTDLICRKCGKRQRPTLFRQHRLDQYAWWECECGAENDEYFPADDNPTGCGHEPCDVAKEREVGL